MVPFGFGVGDFIAVGDLALKVYQRCKNSVTEFRDLSREVASLQIVLSEIASFWSTEENKGNDLSIEQKDRLERATEDCEEVLHDLEALLEKHCKLGAGATFASRMRWAPKDINPIRNRLILRATLLSTLNVTITASSNANSLAQVLQALTVIHKEHQAGSRIVPAFSRAAVEDLDSNANDIWGEITSEIGEQGVNSVTIIDHCVFVRRWIDSVIMEEFEEQDDYGDPPDSPPWPPSATTPEETLPNHGKLVIGLSQPQEATKEGCGTSQDTQSKSCLMRSSSVSSHKSQDSTWHPVQGSIQRSVLALMTTILRLNEHGPQDATHVDRLAKRVCQLDWRNQGILSRHIVHDACRNAMKATAVPLKQEELSQLIAAGDKNKDGVIDSAEFTEIIKSLLTLLNGKREEKFDTDVLKDIEQGRAEQARKISQQQVLQWGWQYIDPSVVPDSRGLYSYFRGAKWVFSHDLGSWLSRSSPPWMPHNSFTMIVTLISRLCIPILDSRLEDWSDKLIALPPDLYDEYRNPMKDVLTAASKFLILDPEARNETQLLWLDNLEQQGALCHTGLHSAFDASLIETLTNWKLRCYKVCSYIQGFVHVLNGEKGDKPMDLSEWRRLQMKRRADYILRSARKWFAKAPVFMTNVRNLFHGDNFYEGHVINGLSNAVKFRKMQFREEENRIEVRYERQATPVSRGIDLELVSANNLPKLSLLRLPSPVARITWPSDDPRSAYTYTSSTCDKTRNPEWHEHIGSYRRPTPVRSETVLTIRIFGSNTKLLAESYVRVGDVAELSNLNRQPATIKLLEPGTLNRAGTVSIAITPQSNKPKAAPIQPAETIKKFMLTLTQNPIPNGWEREELSDGRSCFFVRDQSKSNGKRYTVACQLPPSPSPFDPDNGEEAPNHAVLSLGQET